jgi:hypothetical protein
VSSLLLFNTSENLYNTYVSLDPLEGKEKEKPKQPDNKNILAAAPITVTEGDKMVYPSHISSPSLIIHSFLCTTEKLN